MIGIVICHKTMAMELVNTAHSILGYSNDLISFTNEKLTTEEAVKQVFEHLKKVNNHKEVIFMTDMRGGNCWTIAQMVARDHENFFVLSGVNLPMILSFLTKKDLMSARELAETMDADARRGIVLEK
jgi:mannose/fructose-specific phosphotransferase system component IIA